MLLKLQDQCKCCILFEPFYEHILIILIVHHGKTTCHGPWHGTLMSELIESAGTFSLTDAEACALKCSAFCNNSCSHKISACGRILMPHCPVGLMHSFCPHPHPVSWWGQFRVWQQCLPAGVITLVDCCLYVLHQSSLGRLLWLTGMLLLKKTLLRELFLLIHGTNYNIMKWCKSP